MPHTFSATQDAILAKENMEPTWLFEVSTDYYWSFKDIEYSTQAYTGKILPSSFNGVSVTRSKSEYGVQVPSGGTITVSNAGNVLAESDFKTAGVFKSLTIKLLFDSTLFLTYLFKISRVDDIHQQLVIHYEDYITQYLEGTWPNTEYFSAIAPDDNIGPNYCIPVPFGTVYIPTAPLFLTGDDVYYILSESALGTGWTISAMTSPRELGSYSWWLNNYYFAYDAFDAANFVIDEAVTWDGGASTGTIVATDNGDPEGTMTINVTAGTLANNDVIAAAGSGAECVVDGAVTHIYPDAQKAIAGTNYRVFQPLVAAAHAVGAWSTKKRYAPITQYKVTGGTPDVSTYTAVDDVLEYILEDMGVPSANIDSAGSFAATETEVGAGGWGLTFNYGYYFHQDRKKVIADILNAFNCYLALTDKVELHYFDKTSRVTLTSADIKNFQIVSGRTKTIYDGAFVAFQEANQPQDLLNKYAVAADNTSYSNISSEVLEIPFYTNDQYAQRACQLWQQRKWYGDKKFKFDTKRAQIEYMPDDTITINDSRYGGSFTALIDTVHIDRSGMPTLTVLRLDTALEDWGDETPANVAFVADATAAASISQTVGTGEHGAVQSGNNIRLKPGADIYLESMGGDRAVIDFGVETYDVRIAADYNDQRLAIFPSTDGECNFSIGYDESGTDKKFDNIYILAEEYFIVKAEHGANLYSSFFLDPDFGGMGSVAKIDCYRSANDYARMWINSNDADDTSYIFNEVNTTDGPVISTTLGYDSSDVPFFKIHAADTYWTGSGSGLPYGELYDHDAANTITVSSSSTYYKIDSLTLGENNLVTENSDAFNVGIVGRYLVNYSISCYSVGVVSLESSVFLNNAEQTNTNCQVATTGTFYVMNLSGTGILDITDTGHDVELKIKNNTDTNDIVVGEVNFTIVHIGGT